MDKILTTAEYCAALFGALCLASDRLYSPTTRQTAAEYAHALLDCYRVDDYHAYLIPKELRTCRPR